MDANTIGGVVRTILAAIGGYFVGKGVLDASTSTAIAGAGGTIAVAIWSVLSKKPMPPAPPASN